MNKLAAEYKPRLLELTKISAPIIVEQIFITVMGMVNTAMVSSVGDYAVAAAGIIDSVSNLIIAVFAALTTGGAIVVAQYFGRQDRAGASKAGAQSAILALALSLIAAGVFAVFRTQIILSLFGKSDTNVVNAGMEYFRIVIISYPFLAVMQTLFGVMRGCGDTGSPMLITLLMNLLNFILGYILILGINLFGIHTAGFGVTGAAAAITLARMSGMIASIIYITRKSKAVRLNRLSYFKPDFITWRAVLGLGIPTSVESTLFQVGRLITQLFIVGMGEAALAANTVASSVSGFINVPGSAFSMGVMILVGHRVGRGQESDIKKTSIFATAMGSVMMGLVCLLCMPFIGTLGKIYNLSPDAYAIFFTALFSSLMVTPFLWAPSFILPASLRATGDVNFTMAVAIISMWAFRIVSGYIFGVAMGLGVLGIWMGMYVDWFVRSVLFTWRLLSGKWKKHLKTVSN